MIFSTKDGPEADEVTYEGKQFRVCPGLKWGTEDGLLTAKRVGWITSFDLHITWNGEDTVLDYIPKAAMDKNLKHFCNGLLKLVSKRKGVKVGMTKDERDGLPDVILRYITSTLGSDAERLTAQGYLVLRKSTEKQTTDPTAVKRKVMEFALRGKMPPIIMTPLASRTISDQNDLLSMEKTHQNSIVFDPELSFFDNTMAPQHSTKVKSEMEEELEGLTHELSNVTLDQDLALGDLSVIAGCHAAGEDGDESISSLNETLDETYNVQRTLAQSVLESNLKLDKLKEEVREKVCDQSRLIAALSNDVEAYKREIKAKDNTIQELKNGTMMVKEEYEERITPLEEEIEQLRQAQHDLKQELSRRVKPEHFEEVTEANADLEEKLREKAEKQRTLIMRVNQLRQEAKAKEKASELNIQTLTGQVAHLNSKIMTNHEKALKLTEENIELESKNQNLTNKVSELEKKVASALATSRRVSSGAERVDAFKQEIDGLSTYRLSTASHDTVFASPAQKKSNLRSGDITDMFKPASPLEPSALVHAISTKEVSQLLPRRKTGEDIKDFTKKIESAWQYAKAETFDEKKFCQLLRINLDSDTSQVFDNLSSADQESVSAIVKELNSKLDRTPIEYLRMFQQATKLPTESYSAFAMRLKRLYATGTSGQATATLSKGEQSVIVEQFLSGLPANERTALRMVATEEESQDVELLAKRAARSRPGGEDLQPVCTLKEQKKVTFEGDKPRSNDNAKSQVPTKQELTTRSKRGVICNFCRREGHYWRECFRRARVNPNWRPRWDDPRRPNNNAPRTRDVDLGKPYSPPPAKPQ